MRCSNCGKEIWKDTEHCPECGAFNVPGSGEYLVNKGMDVVLGIVTALGLYALFGLGLLISPIILVINRNKYPKFCLGLTIGWVLPILVLAGMFVSCMHYSSW